VRERVDALERQALKLAGEEQADRDAITGLLGKIAKDPLGTTEPRLIRARARLEKKLDRTQKALETLEANLSDGRGTAEDHLLAAEIALRAHAISGVTDSALSSMVHAEKASDMLGGDAHALLVAWKAAIRGGRDQDASRLGESIQGTKPASIEARLVGALRKFDRSDTASLDGLLALENELPAPDPELAFAIASLLLQKTGDAHAVAEAVDRITLAVDHVPSSREFRNVAVVAYHASGDQARRDQHLQWLLSNAKGDSLYETWQKMLGAPTGR